MNSNKYHWYYYVIAYEIHFNIIHKLICCIELLKAYSQINIVLVYFVIFLKFTVFIINFIDNLKNFYQMY